VKDAPVDKPIEPSVEQGAETAPLHAWEGTHLLQALQAAHHWLKQHVAAINALNVFPVPDGDTGTNMNLTMAAALEGVVPEASCARVSEQIYRKALMGARGNSGVILSQIFRGVAQGMANTDVCGPAELANALVQASITAYRGASAPREGTMLTVIRETGEAAQVALTEKEANLLTVLATAVEAARASVERTPSLLKVLRDAGVVDAGGQGVFVILEGMLRWMRGESVRLEHDAAIDQEFAVAFKDIHSPDDFGYCTNVLISGIALPYEDIRQYITDVGTSVVVVGDESLVRIHVHTQRPGDILNYAIQFGDLLQIEIANMDQQRAALHRSEPAPAVPAEPQPVEVYSPIGVVAVAPGSGFAQIFRSLNVGAVVNGGQTMNPSTQDLVQAIETLPQHDVIVLPNNSNIIMAAQQAAQLTAKQVHVLPSKTAPQGIAALVGLGYQRDLAANLAAMQQEMQRVVTAEITTAVRDAQIDGVEVRAGQTIALLNGDLVEAGDDPDQVVDAIVARMGLETLEIITVYYGQLVSLEQAQSLAARIENAYPSLEIEVQPGGQPFYDYILSAE
jgi:hypothetical protein